MRGDTWIVQSTGNPQFPYRIALTRGTETLFAVRAKDKWPGAGTNIFCIRDGSTNDDVDLFEELERVPIVGFEVFGKRISVTLERPNRKRCEFLVLDKLRKSGEGGYEQIFFRTQAAIQGHRSRSKVALRGDVQLEVVVDSHERYAWKFPGARTSKRALPVGDYALVSGGEIIALAERKSYDNLLGDFGSIVVLHQTLRELAGYPSVALVVEARYGDFLDPKRLKGRWTAGYCCRVLGELQAMHPTIPFIFAGTRKEANIWTWSFFRAAARRTARLEESGNLFAANPKPDDYARPADLAGRLLDALGSAPDGLTAAELASSLGDVDGRTLRSALSRLKARGKVSCASRGIKARWRATRDPEPRPAGS